MSSAEVFAHAARVHEQALALRQKADLLQQAVDQVRLSPGTATSTLSAPTWAGPKALATEQLMQVSFDVLRFAVTQATGDVEELRAQARRLDDEADQLEIEAKRLAYQEAEAEAEAPRQRAIAAANVNAAAAAARAAAAKAAGASSSSASGNSSSSSNANPALTFAPITTSPAVSAPIAPTNSEPSSSAAESESVVAASAF